MIEVKKSYLIFAVIIIVAVVVIVAVYIFVTKTENVVQPPVVNQADISSTSTETTSDDTEVQSISKAEESVMLEGTEKYEAGWTDGLTKQQILDRMNKDAIEQASLEDSTLLKGTEKYEAGWTDGLTKQQILDRMNNEADEQNKVDGVIILEGSDTQGSQ